MVSRSGLRHHITEIALARRGLDLAALERSRGGEQGNDRHATFVRLTGGKHANLPLPNGHAMLKGPRETGEKNWGSVSGNATRPGLEEPGIGWHLSETTADEFQEYCRAALRRLDFCFAGRKCFCAGENRQDRRDISTQRQRCQRR